MKVCQRNRAHLVHLGPMPHDGLLYHLQGPDGGHKMKAVTIWAGVRIKKRMAFCDYPKGDRDLMPLKQ